ncbi:hypothetical protein [Methanosphaerula palustris]|uniref:Methyltransferase type 11 n=1 Tax=Methanosphaerula palustris (strain ATCC BAA-1556 / DSM 19958 / E1-9c) TaxID=521011 RepID=B8GFN5_METPE|nr:hypothetical protein [Methanosphaerula palustris]ACL17918.1 conserved hypothetical protein [Methanosphaerula palustris E1-9c]
MKTLQNAARILDLAEVRFIEPTLSEMTDPVFSEIIGEGPISDGRLLIDEQDQPLAAAFCGEDGWTCTSFLYRPVSVEVLELFEETDGDLYQESRDAWAAAVREYYADEMLAMVVPSAVDLTDARTLQLKNLLAEIWQPGQGVTCLDCCCGSGVGSAVLREMGMHPLAYDNDPHLLALGLASGRLVPVETLCIDGTEASVFLSPAERGIGSMLGAVYPFTADLWHQIVDELLNLTRETVITVGTEPEQHLVREWCEEQGRTVEAFENERDPIYDRFVCVARL